ncbi:MAG: hypothetical protein NC483_02570 [Ruminococcus sp.]|nr:hypothetical protein [Ruminococcus sp.]
MHIYFSFERNFKNFNITYLDKASINVIKRYKYAFIACLNIASYFTNYSNFKVESTIFEEKAIVNLNCYGKILLTFEINDDKIILYKKYKDTCDIYTFLYDLFDEITLTLTSMTLNSENIYQEFQKHRITLTKICGDKKFTLKIPIDVTRTISSDILSSLHEGSSLRDLEQLYFKYFYPDQKTYDIKEETVLEICDSISDSIETVEVLSIKNGTEASYQISELRDNLNLTLLKESASDDYQLTFNYKAQDPKVDVNSMINRLQEKCTTFHEKPFLRLLKPQG